MSSHSKRSSTILLFPILLILVVASSCKTHRKISKSDHFYEEYATKLGIQLSGNENKKLVSTIAGWLGTPYKYGGCDKGGTDCSCFVRNVVREVYGYELHRRSEDMILNVNKVSKDDLREGDLVFFKISGNKISHVGICINNHKFAHTSKNRGVVINDLNEAYYSKYFHCGGRIKQ